MSDELAGKTVLVVEVSDGPHAGQAFELTGRGPFTVGRQPGLHVTLGADPHLSRVHCTLEPDGGGARVTDLGSRGGVFVNGARVEQGAVGPADAVTVGETVFRVRVPADDGTTQASGPAPVPKYADAPPAIPGYRFEEELGRGGMGVVYRAVRESDGEVVAVKTILPAVAPTAVAVGRFCREADILGRLTHPNVVGHRAGGTAGGLLYVVMEFVPGVTASAVVARDGPLAPARALRWADQFLDALGHAHERGFVHRDVKPANLLVVERAGAEVVKVADFGLARAYESSGMSAVTTDGSAGGTPAYMPPEQVTDFRRVKPAADQYAAAATLFFLLTGRPVYDPGTTAVATLNLILTADPVPLRPDAPPLPDPFASVIRRALARDQTARFADVRAMRRALLGG
jgi:serine/threonine-protein kinase